MNKPHTYYLITILICSIVSSLFASFVTGYKYGRHRENQIRSQGKNVQHFTIHGVPYRMIMEEVNPQ